MQEWFNAPEQKQPSTLDYTLQIQSDSERPVVRKCLGSVSDKLPLILTPMLPFEQAKQNLGRLAQAMQLSVSVLGVNDATANASKLGRRETFVYLSKDDIIDPTWRRVSEKLISQQFL